MADQDGDKSQDATPHRRQQAREQGQVARSQDLASAAVLLGGVLAVLMMGPSAVDFFGGYAHRQLGAWQLGHGQPADAVAEFYFVAWELTRVVLPILAVTMAVAVVSNLMQSGVLFLPEKLVPDLSRLDPVQGLSRLFSLPNFVRLGFGVFKIGIVGVVAFMSVRGQWDEILGATAMSVGGMAVFLVELLLWTTIKIGVALLLLALLDFGFQWWKQEQDMKMTTQEVREEMKNLQGDPQVIARRRAVQRQLVLNRLSSSVPKADVVVTNPTELAVAIQYDPETMQAPVVVAKGAGSMAQRIRKLALEHGIPIVEKKPLAQLLYKDVEINHPVPQQSYSAVAEVLAYVYQLKGKKLPKRMGLG